MSIEKTSINSDDTTLPYGTTSDNILKLIDAIKKKEGNEESIKKVYSGKKLDTTRKSLEIIGIIEEGLTLSNFGRALVFETDEKIKKKIFLERILEFPPYELLLLNIGQQGFPDETDLEVIKSYWGKHSYGSSPNNREEAAVVFGNFLELAGLGQLVVGRRGKNSRIKWNPKVSSLINETARQKENVPIKLEDENETVSIENESLPNEDPVTTIESIILPNTVPTSKNNPTLFNISPNISINVDMSDWEIEKISAFFKAAYGNFGDK